MTKEDIKTLRMIASNCNLEKAQRDMLIKIADEQEKYLPHDLIADPEDVPPEERANDMFYAFCFVFLVVQHLLDVLEEVDWLRVARDDLAVGIDEEAENAHILETSKKLWGALNHREY